MPESSLPDAEEARRGHGLRSAVPIPGRPGWWEVNGFRFTTTQPEKKPVTRPPKPPKPMDPDDLKQVYQPRLLRWLARRDPDGSWQPLSDVIRGFTVENNLEFAELDWLLSQLAEAGFVGYRRAEDESDGAVAVDSEGWAAAFIMEKELRDHGRRLHYTIDALLHWMFDNHRGELANVAEFAGSREAFLHGEALTAQEIASATRYLADRKLLAPAPPDAGLRLTADGQDCAISGVSVSKFLTPDNHTGDTYNFNGNVQGAAIGGRSNSIAQTNHYGANLAEVGQLIQVASLARQIHSTLDLTEPEQAEVLESAQALELEARSNTPDQTRLRKTTDRFMAALNTATNVTGALRLLIEQGHKAYSAVFGG